MSKIVRLTDLSRELVALAASKGRRVRVPTYKQAYAAVLDGRLPTAEDFNSSAKYNVDLEVAAELFGIVEKTST